MVFCPQTSTWKKRFLQLTEAGKLLFYNSKADSNLLDSISLAEQKCSISLVTKEGFRSVLCISGLMKDDYFMYTTPLPETLLWQTALNLAISQAQQIQQINPPQASLPPQMPLNTTTTTTTSISPSQYEDYLINVQYVNNNNNNNNNNSINSGAINNSEPLENTHKPKPASSVQLFYYMVNPGESCVDIVKIFNLSLNYVQSYNSVNLSENLPAGSYLIIPLIGDMPSAVLNNPVLMQAHFRALSSPFQRPEPPLISADDSNLCQICFEKPVNTVLVPCGHSGLCMECAQAIHSQPCPFCRRSISKVVVTYKT